MATDDTTSVLRRERYVARQRADGELKKFFESTPSNIGVKIEHLFGEYHPQARNTTWSARPIPIELFCETCGGQRFFEPRPRPLDSRNASSE